MSKHALTDFGITWHDIVRPKEEDLRALQRKYRFHELDIEDCLSDHERPKLEVYDNYVFVLFHIPYASGGRILKAEVGIFIGEKFFVTVHDGSLDQLEQLRHQMQRSANKREEFLGKGSGFFLYRLMEQLFEAGFPLVESITRRLRKIEDTLFRRDEGPDVFREVLTTKRNIITMRSILLPQRTLVASIQHQAASLLGEGLQPYFDDILDAIERQWALLDNARELSEALHDTQESWLTFKTNAVVRALTVVSATLLPLNMLIGLYGMNVPLPYATNPLAFWMIVGSIGAVFAAIVVYAASKRWL